MNPQARRTDVVAQRVGGDMVVYDQLRDAAHSLSGVAAHVYEHADGTRDAETLAAGASAALGVPHDLALVEEALAELERVHLLTGEPAGRRAIGRREALYRMGVAAVPLVTSLAVPSPVLAQSRDDSKPKKPKKPKKSKKGR